MQTAIRFYAELNDHLSVGKAQTEYVFLARESLSVKEMIESLGVPATEVDLILVNGESVDFSYGVVNGDRISVFPVFESLDITSLTKLRQKPLRTPRFVADVHLGKLARYLRMFGFDTLYENSYTDDELLFISKSEKRVLLTKDRKLLQEHTVERAFLIEPKEPRTQLTQILRRFDLFNSTAAFQRCLCCNSLLERVAKQVILHRLPPKVKAGLDDFQQCKKCDKIYWKGTHYERMQDLIGGVLIERGKL